MIKINVITNNKNWLNYIKRPNSYLDKKIKKFRMIALHNPEYEKERSAIVQGDCKVSN